MTLDLISSLVNRETNESDLITPLLFVVLEHFLVMSHWSLARWTPGCPEVEKNDLTSFMLDNSITTIELANISDITHSAADSTLH